MDRTAEVREKIERLVRILAAERSGGVLINARHNFTWLTAGGSSTLDTTREMGIGSLMVRADGKCFVLANRIEMARLQAEELPEKVFEPVDFSWEEEKRSATFFADRAASLLSSSSPLLSDMALGNCKVAENSIARCRYQLTTSEIDRYRDLGQDAAAAVEDLIKHIEPGLTEQEVAASTDTALAARGCRSAVTLVAADERLKLFRHPYPTAKRWRKLLMIVVCAERTGLIASLTRIACDGDLPDELKRRTVATAKVNAELMAATKPGAPASELYEVAARSYEAEGFPGEQHLHHQGGATGYRTREWAAHPACEEVVQLHQAFAWNPSITGTKVEETCLTKDEGLELLTSRPTWPQIRLTLNGIEYLSPDILVR
jgi:Xaa-Pro aminopeptidase